jgi:chaperonin GroEL (HSP60 family)
MPDQPDGAVGADSEDEFSFPHANIEAVERVGDILASSFGPTPRDKLLITKLATRSEDDPRVKPPTDEYVVTSDGATILETLDLQHPVAPLVRRVTGPERPGETDVEGKDITDGIKTSILLVSNLLLEARTLIDDGVHPTTIQHGYSAALEEARSALSDARLEPTEERILAAARTALTGNDVGGARDRWAQMAVDAVSQVGVPTEKTFAVRSASGKSIDEARFVRGTVLDKNERANDRMPRRIEDANVLVIGGGTDGGLKRRETAREVTIETSDPEYATEFEELRAGHRRELFDTVLETGATVVVAQTGITADYQSLLAEHGILGIRRVNSQKLRQVARATGATIVKDPRDSSPEMLGTAGVVEEIELPEYWTKRGDRRMIVFDDCPDPDAVAVLLTGVWRQIADQLTSSIRKAALAAAMTQGAGRFEGGCVPGGGAVDLSVSRRVRARSTEYGTKEQLAMQAFADAVDRLVGILARNGGLDPLSTLPNLRQSHEAGDTRTGIVLPDGRLDDVVAAGVLEPLAYKRRAYDIATQVANLIVNIDDAIDAEFDEDPIEPDEAINDDAAERHMDFLEDRDKPTRWD